MLPRKKLLAGIFALVAMAFSFTETVAASACGSGMAMEKHHVAEAQHGPGDASPSSHERGHHRGGEGERDQSERHCPFAPVLAGCAGVSLFPSRPGDDIVPLLGIDHAAFPEPVQHRVLLPDALFHPPRA